MDDHLQTQIDGLKGKINLLELALRDASLITEGTLDCSKVNIINVQKSNLVDSDSEFFQSERNAIRNSVNLCVKKGDLISQLNLEAGRVLINSDEGIIIEGLSNEEEK